MSLDKLFSGLKAQGFYGHVGRPGKRGGSSPKGAGSGSTKKINGVPLTEPARAAYAKAIKKYKALKWKNTFNSRLYFLAGGRKEVTPVEVKDAEIHTDTAIENSKK